MNRERIIQLALILATVVALAVLGSEELAKLIIPLLNGG